MKWIYRKTEPSLWTVGFYEPSGAFEPESDHGSPDDAAGRVHWLNGGFDSTDQDGNCLPPNGRVSAVNVLHAVLNEAEHDEQCPACEAVYEWDNSRSWCPHHQGLLAGYDRAMGEIGEVTGAFQRDPELVDMVIERAEQMRARDYELAQQAANKPQPVPEGLSEHEKQMRDAVHELDPRDR